MADHDLGNLLGRGSSSRSGKMLGALFNGAGRGAGNSLEGLLDQLRDGGLGAKVASWTGTGDNEDISGAEIAQALPAGLLVSAARSCGLREVDAADQIAETLPVAVDKLTPEGKIPKEALEELIAQQLQCQQSRRTGDATRLANCRPPTANRQPPTANRFAGIADQLAHVGVPSRAT
ncbi:YidB family protein [Streptomyces sp. NPDC055059]